MSSPTHRANILSRRYREVGLAMAVAGPEDSLPARIIYVTEFGVRR